MRAQIDAARSNVDYALTLVFWIATALLVLVFAAQVLRTFGVVIPMFPNVPFDRLAWAAGCAWLLKR